LRVLETILRLAHPIIPFITEELWQTIGPKSGKVLANQLEQSVALQPYPVSQNDKIDPVSEAWIGLVKGIIDACRNLRGEMKISPAQKVPLWIFGDTDFLTKAAPYLSALAKLSEVKIVTDEYTLEKEAPSAPIALVGQNKLLLKIEVDPKTEQMRLAKEVARLAGEIAKCQSKLNNESFITRAPAEVLKLEKMRLADFEASYTKLSEQLEKLKLFS
jgi:valyl-tRNA synthetase